MASKEIENKPLTKFISGQWTVGGVCHLSGGYTYTPENTSRLAKKYE